MHDIYLDNNASTKVDPRVAEVITRNMLECYGNPSSTHRWGESTREHIANGRAHVAEMLGAAPGEIVFTAGGTEADNLAIWGACLAAAPEGKDHVITCTAEHKAVLNVASFLKRFAVKVTLIGVDKKGRIDPEEFKDAITDKTVVASIMLANNETGVLQPIRELADIARGSGVYFHTDAVQAVGKVPVKVDELGVDMLSISGHKFYAPKGVGALYVKEGTFILPITFGGGQERGLRSTTENVPGIVGIGEAARLITEELDVRAAGFEKLRDQLESGMREIWPDMKVNGEGAPRLPNTLSVSLAGVDTAALMVALDGSGIGISAGSACDAELASPSHILAAMGMDTDLALRTLRISVGIFNTEDEIDTALNEMKHLNEK